MKRSHQTALMVAAIFSLVTGGVALSSEGETEAVKALSQTSMTLEEAIGVAKAQFPGRVLDAEFEMEDGQPIYEVEIVNKEGIVREVNVNPQSRQIVDSEVEDEQDEQNDGEND